MDSIEFSLITSGVLWDSGRLSPTLAQAGLRLLMVVIPQLLLYSVSLASMKDVCLSLYFFISTLHSIADLCLVKRTNLSSCHIPLFSCCCQYPSLMFQEGSVPSCQKFFPFPLLLWTLSSAPALPIKHNPSLPQLLHWNQHWPKCLSLHPMPYPKSGILLTTVHYFLEGLILHASRLCPPLHLLPMPFLSAWSFLERFAGCSLPTQSDSIHPYLFLSSSTLFGHPCPSSWLSFYIMAASVQPQFWTQDPLLSLSHSFLFYSVWLFTMPSKLEPCQVELLGFACPLPKCLSCDCYHFKS